MAKASIVHSIRGARAFSTAGALENFDAKNYQALASIGLVPTGSPEVLRNMLAAHGLDSNDVGINPASAAGITAPGVPNLVQFLQAWLPGFVHTTTAARNIDLLTGMATVGSWEDEEIVQGILEPIGTARPYSDHQNIPLTSWNANFEKRTVVRFESGMEVGVLEEARSARIRVSTSAEKRAAAALSLDISRNRIGFYGYNDGYNRTYGFLNDPNLPSYTTLPAGASGGTEWSGKTFLEITRDLRVALSQLRVQSKGVIDPKKTPITMAVALGAVDFLSTTSDYGVSALNWLNTNYPNVRIESAPELDDANGGDAVFYMYAEKLTDNGTDGGDVFKQLVPIKFMTVGVEKRSKVYAEDYSNATAGVLCARPFAVVRFTGV